MYLKPSIITKKKKKNLCFLMSLQKLYLITVATEEPEFYAMFIMSEPDAVINLHLQGVYARLLFYLK